MSINFKKSIPFKNSGSFTSYDSGEVDANTTEQTITLTEEVSQLLINPTVNSKVKLNDSTKEIYLPAGVWTPLSIRTTSFTIKTIDEPSATTDTIYWMGWIL